MLPRPNLEKAATPRPSVGHCVCRLFIFKVTGPSPLRGYIGVRQKGGYPDPPPVVPHPESLAAQAAL